MVGFVVVVVVVDVAVIVGVIVVFLFVLVVVVVVVKVAVVVVIVFVSDGVGALVEFSCRRISSASPLASSSHLWTLTIRLWAGSSITETFSAMPMDNTLGSAQKT